MKRAFPTILLASMVLAAGLQPLAASALDVLPGFNPSLLIPDTSFGDTQTFGGPEGIQRFLESKNSVLANTSPDFLAKLGEPDNALLKQTLEDPEPSLGRLRTAAELIYDAGRASGMNPQVILVTLHKEQGLIGPVDASRLPKALRNAMGFACPDAAGCGDLFPGFYYQLFGNVDTQGNRYLGATKSLMKSFTTPGGRGPTIAGAPAKIGQSLDIANTLGDYAGIPAKQTVTIGNSATAALYRYTPHVFNGNYNFWKYFTSWFKYPNGTLLKSTFDQTVYILNDGLRQRVPQFVAVARGMNLSASFPVSPTELEGYPAGPVYGPIDNTLISVNGEFFVFEDGIKHPASSFVLTQRKLDPAQIMPISVSDAALFAAGTQLTPSEGTVLKAPNNPDVYLVDGGVLKKYSQFTFTQYGAGAKLQLVPADEVAIYPEQGYVAPKEGTLIKSKSGDGVYVMDEGRRSPLTAELFKNHKYNLKSVVALTTDEELASIPVGPPAKPAEGTFFSIGKTQELYLFKGGTKHPITPFVARQRKITPDYFFEASIVSNWQDGIAIPPNDGTLLKSDAAPSVYVVAKGQLRPLSGDIFKLLKYSFKNVAVVPDAEVSILPKGPYAAPPDGTYFAVSGSGEFYRFEKGAKRRIYPLVAKQRGMSPDYTFAPEVSDGWELGAPVAPRDGTLLRGDGSTQVFVVVQTALRPINDAAFKRRGYKTANIKTIPQADLDGFPKGDELK